MEDMLAMMLLQRATTTCMVLIFALLLRRRKRKRDSMLRGAYEMLAGVFGRQKRRQRRRISHQGHTISRTNSSHLDQTL